MLILVLAVATALIVSFLCSIFEAVLLSVGHARVEALGREGRRAGAILHDFKRSMEVPIAAILILNTFAHTVGAAVAGAKYVDQFGDATLWVFSLVFTLAVLFFTEIIPKTVGFTFRDALAAPVALAVRTLVIALRPAIAVINLVTRSMRPREETPVTSEDEIRLLAALGRAEGVIGPRTAEIIEGTTSLRELTAADAMMPRNRVVFLSGSLDVEENLARVRASGHSRFPFIRGGQPDRVEGVVHAKELLFHLREHGDTIDWTALLRRPLFVPATASLHGLLRTFQEESQHLAIVVDEYGGMDGIVTLEDVLEELVGEIWDESDRRHVRLVEQGEGRFLCSGLAETRVVANELGIELDTGAVTISGFVTERLGALPKRGDEVTEGGHVFRVLKANRRRAEQLEIVRASGS